MVCKMNINEISETLKSIIKNTAEKLSGFKRRTYIAEITIELLDKSTRKAERAVQPRKKRTLQDIVGIVKSGGDAVESKKRIQKGLK